MIENCSAKRWESTGFNSGIEYSISTRAGNQDKARGHGGLLRICIAYHKLRAQPDVKATRKFLILAGPVQDPAAQLWRRLHLFWIFSVGMRCQWIPFPKQRIDRRRRRVTAFCASSASLGARMRQEMSVWYELSSGRYTNSSPLFASSEKMWSGIQPCPADSSSEFLCSFNTHTILFVLVPKLATCHNCSAIGHQPAKHDCPGICPGSCCTSERPPWSATTRLSSLTREGDRTQKE